jgi:hypothetical protein
MPCEGRRESEQASCLTAMARWWRADLGGDASAAGMRPHEEGLLHPQEMLQRDCSSPSTQNSARTDLDLFNILLKDQRENHVGGPSE